MTFLWPGMLFLLLLLPLFVGVYLYLQRRRRTAVTSGGLKTAQGNSGRSLGFRRHVPEIFFLLGLAILL